MKNKKFCEDLISIFPEKTFNIEVLKNNIYAIYTNKISQVDLFYKYAYYEGCFCLERKRNQFMQFYQDKF